jgi:PAS domain S-box-containing protein
MAKESERATALRACGLVDGGADDAFTRLARLAVFATRAPMCVLAFGDEPRTFIKACAGPPEMSPVDVLNEKLYFELVEGAEEAVAHDAVAGAVVRAPAGLPVGAWCARTDSPRVWTEDALDVLNDIARLTQTELALREKRRPDEQTATILESMSDACVFLDRDFRYTYVNGKAGQIFGRNPHDLVGKHIWTEFPEGIGQKFDLAYREAVRTQTPQRIEEYYPPWKRWFENRIYPAREGLAIFFQDITERKIAEESSRRESLLRAQVEQMAHVGYWVWSIPENKVCWSDELYRIYGLAPTEFGASFEAYLNRLHPLDATRVRETVEQALRDRSAATFEERIVRPSGEIRHLHSWGSVSVAPDGQPTEMFGACLDMTDLILTTENLRRTGEWLETAIFGARIAVFEWNVQTNVVRWSDGAATAVGLAEGELGESFDAYLNKLHPDDRRPAIEALRASVATCKELDIEHRVVQGDARVRWISVRGRVYASEGGRASRIVGTLMDVTDRRNAEHERFALQEELRHAQKMEAIGRLSTGIAHDFNNLFMLIRGAAELLVAKTGAQPDIFESVRAIDEAVDRATALTKQILAFSRRQPLSLVRLDMNQVVDDMCTTLRRLLPSDIELALSLSPGLPGVRADRSQLEQVLLNLIVNARDAMPGGGTLKIATRITDHQIELEVRDTGVGMTDEVRSRIFEPYYTTKDGVGTGIGLSTVYGIVTGSHGTVDVKSEPGKGSTFTVRLPAAE